MSSPSSVGGAKPPAWLPPSAVAAISAASAALSAAFDSPQPPAPASSSAPPPPPDTPRPLLDLFPPVASRQATAPSLPVGEPLAPPRIAAVGPPRVASRPRAVPPVSAPRAAYETFYGLSEPPFAPAADLRFLYHAAAHDRALQDLLSSVGRHDAVAVLTAEAGVGKTTLCRALTEQLDRRTLVSFITGGVTSPDHLLRTLLVDFGVISADDLTTGRLASASHDDLAGALRDFIGSLAVLQASALLIVDDAHALPAAVFGELCALSDLAASAHLLQIVLVGEPSLTRQLRARDLRAIEDRVTLRTELGPLEPDEVDGYVAHRLAVAGRGDRVGFSEGAARHVFRLSGGVPGVINQIGDRALTLGCQASASHIGRDLVDQAAEQIGLVSADEGGSWRERVLVALLMLALMLAGAAGAGWLFRAPLGRAISHFSSGRR